jgi:hypothetical protein
MARLIAASLAVALAAPALAQDPYGDGRIRYLEAGVLLQRAGESEVEEALVNLPFLPGDRLWSDDTGRVELQFEGTAVVRLDSRGKLDYLSRDPGRRNDRVLLRLWSGGLYFHVRDGGAEPDFELETPAGLVELLERGVYRVDVEGGETRLSVFEGEAAFGSGGRRIRVNSGERSYARRGEDPEPSAPFDLYEDDAFALWDREREDDIAWAGDSQRYLPEDVGYYGGELESAGSWYYESEIGHVWRPYVTTGWQPYSDGHWIWCSYGWTWVPYEPWGWVTHHYGRWGYSPVLGWYWIPGGVWGPGWVSWAVGGDYVGWCPLGYHNRAVVPPARGPRYAVPRGTAGLRADAAPPAPADGIPNLTGYNFVHKGDMGTRRLVSRRFAVQGEAARALRVAESPRALTRELKLSDTPVASALRTVKTRPSFADTVPELRGDPATTIPIPTLRRRDRDDEAARRFDTRRSETGSSRPTDLRSPREAAPAARPRDGSSGDAWRSLAAPERGSRPTDRRSPGGDAARPRDTGRGAPAWAPRPQPQQGEPPAPRREGVHDVLRRFFQPANEGRSRDGGQASPRSEPRQATPQRAEPRRSDPPSQPPAKSQPRPTPQARPKKEKDR